MPGDGAPAASAAVAVIGAGIAGIAAAYHLVIDHGIRDVILIDPGQPMGFTSAQSGENYRNWWPHPAMVAFTDRSIDLMERIARASGNRIAMTRRGYALATRRSDVSDLMAELAYGLGDRAEDLIRVHSCARASAPAYRPPHAAAWDAAPAGVDVLQSEALIRETFPSFAADIKSVVHIRRGGDISGQQMGAYMLDTIQDAGGRRLQGSVEEIGVGGGVTLSVRAAGGSVRVAAERVVNAAGPFAPKIAAMLGTDLPVTNVFQQKIAFEDTQQAIPRQMPFAIDLDGQTIDWSAEDRAALADDPHLAWLAGPMPGAIHCRPEGGDAGRWVKLGWAFNETPAEASWEPPLMAGFPEIVLRGAARLNPALRSYYGRLPRQLHHYGGWYTMTEENWPLIGPVGRPEIVAITGLSGFGTMAACAAGELAAAWVAGAELPSYAEPFSLARYADAGLMGELRLANRGVL